MWQYVFTKLDSCILGLFISVHSIVIFIVFVNRCLCMNVYVCIHYWHGFLMYNCCYSTGIAYTTKKLPACRHLLNLATHAGEPCAHCGTRRVGEPLRSACSCKALFYCNRGELKFDSGIAYEYGCYYFCCH